MFAYNWLTPHPAFAQHVWRPPWPLAGGHSGQVSVGWWQVTLWHTVTGTLWHTVAQQVSVVAAFAKRGKGKHNWWWRWMRMGGGMAGNEM